MQIKRYEINEQMHNHIQKHSKHIEQENIKRVVANHYCIYQYC